MVKLSFLYSAALDKIDQDILIQGLHNVYDINIEGLNWFLSYLSERTQAAIIKGTISDMKEFIEVWHPTRSQTGPCTI